MRFTGSFEDPDPTTPTPSSGTRRRDELHRHARAGTRVRRQRRLHSDALRVDDEGGMTTVTLDVEVQEPRSDDGVHDPRSDVHVRRSPRGSSIGR